MKTLSALMRPPVCVYFAIFRLPGAPIFSAAEGAARRVNGLMAVSAPFTLLALAGFISWHGSAGMVRDVGYLPVFLLAVSPLVVWATLLSMSRVDALRPEYEGLGSAKKWKYLASYAVFTILCALLLYFVRVR